MSSSSISASASAELPSVALVRDAALVVAVFGQFNLYDADVRGVRVSLGAGNVPLLELDVDIAGASALPGGAADHSADYRVTLRCNDVSDLSLADFGEANVVSEYSFAVDGMDDDGHRTIRVAFTCAPGCDLDLHCRDVAVTRVTRVG